MSTSNTRTLERKAKLAEIRAQFPSGDCFLVSVAGQPGTIVGGQTVEVPLDTAAELLTAGSHRIATATEITTWRTEQAKARQAIEAANVSTRTIYFRNQKEAAR